MIATYIGVGVSITIRVGYDQQVNIHGVQKGGQGHIGTIISGNLNQNTRN